MMRLKRLAVAAGMALACGLGGMSAASACGGGSGGATAKPQPKQPEVFRSAKRANSAAMSFKKAARSGDQAAMRRAMDRLVREKKSKATAEKRQARRRAAQRRVRAARTASR